jgi:inhibitor of KinA
MKSNTRILPMGDRALVVEFGDRPSAELSTRIAAAAQQLRASPPPGLLDIVPGYTTLTLHYDPGAIGKGATPFDALAAQVSAWLDAEADTMPPPSRLVEIPVCYGGAFGEDLDALAKQHRLSAAEVIAIHTGVEYRVHMLGFVPGFAYLGGLDPRLVTPRRTVPRPRVPAGTLGIGGEQTGIYPLDTPGGWHLIGRTPLQMFTPASEPPCLLSAGDRVRFVSIPAQDFAAQAGRAR